MEELKVKRLFIGNISADLFKTPEDLEVRIAKFGSLKSKFELHFNSVRQNGFGYLDIEVSDKSFAKLKGALNGIKYKGGKLVIDEAKPAYEQRWEIDASRSNGPKRAKMLKNEYEFYKKIENINMTYKDRQEIIPGRMRKKPRKGLKHMTLRVNFNGTVKVVKCHKTKLWGYEKNKKLRDLVYRYQNNVWKDGNEHIVERVTRIRLKQGDNELVLEKQRDDHKLLEEFGDEEEEAIEVEKNNKVLASILGNFDFEKPLEYQEEVDEFGGSDYEYNKSDLESDQEEFGLKPVDLSKIEYVKEGEFSKDAPRAEHYDEDADDEVEDIEFVPTFGVESQVTAKEPQPTLVEGTVSNTETLRSLFNEDQSATTFNLIEESDEDIDKTRNPVEADIDLPQQPIVPIIAKVKQRKGLFFPHFESPFLVAQTQLNKLNTNVDFTEWESTFWDKRAELTNEFKRRKRDSLRQMRKKNAKNSRLVV
ncbi:NOP8 [Cyberlindnera jadinii]|uniref:NOP8 protein n=1 Tax=Cyberlindnera jadinii (strain ATCC 18201 / CBS 1600 / BCRC 20928 / JCM 3617 / NBRC 0987 / NRRL Y-1542) TaxID=983966 RepID=A0A0H5CDZ9_CYBJN|nr:NOP8 [Cyberlindnera jadinii]